MSLFFCTLLCENHQRQGCGMLYFYFPNFQSYRKSFLPYLSIFLNASRSCFAVREAKHTFLKEDYTNFTLDKPKNSVYTSFVGVFRLQEDYTNF